MDDYTAEEVCEALHPIASLISKSEKAQLKLAPSTWQYTMLRDNIAALRVASALLGDVADDPHGPDRDDLQQAIHTLDSMIARVEEASYKFSPGTSHHSLQRNRLKALRIARSALTAELERRQ